MAAFFYNKESIGDVLLIKISREEKEVTSTLNKSNLTIIYSNDEIVAYNLFKPIITIKEKGIIYYPTKELIDYVNDVLLSNQLPLITTIDKPHFTVGKVITCDDIEGTHLHSCKVDIKDEVLQIVCGAVNVKAGELVVVARIGCLMRDGSIITQGILRGYQSYGMLCSKKELGIEDPAAKGLYLLDPMQFNIGDEFIVK